MLDSIGDRLIGVHVVEDGQDLRGPPATGITRIPQSPCKYTGYDAKRDRRGGKDDHCLSCHWGDTQMFAIEAVVAWNHSMPVFDSFRGGSRMCGSAPLHC